MFGPEYESINFTSNRSLSTVIAKLLGDHDYKPENSSRRPDLVAVADANLALFSSASFDDRNEPVGVKKVLIIELKKGNYEITTSELRQAEDYAAAIRKSGKIENTTEIVCYVLGTRLHSDAMETRSVGNYLKIHPKTYSHVLMQAQARTFYLQKQIEEAKAKEISDEDVEEILDIPTQPPLL